MTEAEAIDAIQTASGKTLAQLSQSQPQLVVFLRHSGCTFCRQALSDLAQQLDRIRAAGVGLVLVHQSGVEEGARWFAGFGLTDAEQISDPERVLYQAMGLGRASLVDIFRPTVWWNGFKAAVFQGHWFGKIVGDVFQLPGAFVIEKGRIVLAHRHRLASDRPDYSQLVCSIVGQRHLENSD